MPEISPRERALGRLNVREYSASEMRGYLRRKGIPKDEADAVVAELVGEGLIQDLRYSRVIARAQALRDKGPAYIMGKLRSKGVKIDIRKTRELFEEVAPEEETAMARRVLERRYPNARADRKELQRAYQGLLRRGFSRDAIKKCLFIEMSEEPEDNEAD